MSDLRKAAQMALEALESCGAEAYNYELVLDAENALYAALAQPIISPEIKGDKAEPVAYLWQHSETGRTRIIEKDQVWTASNPWKRVGPLYLHPPQRKPLTEEALMALLPEGVRLPPGWRDFAHAIEKAHGIGND
jgi:hypothetical protein